MTGAADEVLSRISVRSEGHGRLKDLRRPLSAIVAGAMYASVTVAFAGAGLYVGSSTAGATPTPGMISTVIGGNAPGPSLATGISVNPSAVLVSGTTLYVADGTSGAGSVIRLVNLLTGTQTVIAGSGGYNPVDGPALQSGFSRISGLALDVQGSLYVTDEGNNLVRKIAGGVVSTVAGNGATADTGDGGTARSAGLCMPAGVVVNAGNDVFVITRCGNRIRKISGGIITTIAGTGTAGFSGDNGPATSAKINPNWLVKLSLDATGNLIYADSGNNRIRRIVPGGNITTIAGGGASLGDGGQATAAKLIQPSMAVPGPGNSLIISDDGNYRIRQVDSNGVITTIAGTGNPGTTVSGGLAVASDLYQNGAGIAVTPAGSVVLTQYGGVWRFPIGGNITTVAGNSSSQSMLSGLGGPAVQAQINRAIALTVDPQGRILVATNDDSVLRLEANGTLNRFAGGGTSGLGDGGPATSAQLQLPYGLAVDTAGNAYIGEAGGYRIRKVATDGTISTIAGTGTAGFSGDTGPATSAQISEVGGLAVDPDGNVIFVDSTNQRVRKINMSDGTINTIAGSGASGFAGDGGPATQAQLNLWIYYSAPFSPGLDVDSAGDIFFVDNLNNRVRKIAGGVISTVAGGGSSFTDGFPATTVSIGQPGDVKVRNGVMYISEALGSRVLLVDTSGKAWSVAGNGYDQYSQDGGLARETALGSVLGAITLDIAGNLYIADRTRIRKVNAFSVPAATTSAPHAVPTNGAAQVSWSWPADGGLPITSFTVTAQPGGSTCTSTNTSSCTVPGLSNGTPYTFTVAATNALGAGPSSAPSLPVTPSTTPGPPTGVVGVAGNAQVTVSWVAPVSNGGSPVTVYTVTASPGGATCSWSSGPLLCTVSGLANGTPYSFTVKATNSAGASLASAPSTSVTPKTAPTSPAGVVAVAGKQQAAVTWSAPGSDGGSPVTGYTVTASPGGATCSWSSGPLSCVVSGLTGATPYTFTVKATNSVGPGPASSASSPVTPWDGSGYHPVTPSRILDSRGSVGGWNAKLATTAKDLQVTGVGGVSNVPASASAVVMNVTVTSGTAGSFVSVWPSGATQPNSSNLNFGAGETIPNLVTVKLGAGGKVSFANALGAVDVIADVVGYYDDGTGAGDLYNGITPTRLLDSRTANGGWNAKLTAGAPRDLTVRQSGNGAGVPSTATAVIANVTVTGGTAGSFVSVWPSGVTQPNVSNLNFGPGQTIPNLVIVKIGSNGAIRFANAVGGVDVIVDVVGYFDPTAGSRFHAINPTRILDDRVPTGLAGPWGPGQTRALPVAGPGTSTPAGATGLVANVTVTGGTAGSFVTVFPDGVAVPNSSNVNFGPGQTIPNLIATKIAANGKIGFYNLAGNVDIIADAVGYYATT